ncbi:hypothetical protein [Clostridium sp. LP20]|uniref:hypothetical protein n=1 Tax=Clostridium sp. LP20 TaxID=3418665 RepID=UPI003EE69771
MNFGWIKYGGVAMNIFTDRKNGIVKWSYNNKDIKIQNTDMMFAFEYANDMVMLKVKGNDSKIGFILYNTDGTIILSYSAKAEEIVIKENKHLKINNLISVEYSKKYNKIIILRGIDDENQKLIIMDCNGDEISSIKNPVGYTFYYTKNVGNMVMVVCQGNSDLTKDKYGRNEWNYRIDLDNYYVEKLSITQ